METESKRKLHPLVATASVAIIVLAGVGIAAFTGVLPTSRGSSAPAEQATANAPAAPAPAVKKEAARAAATHRAAAEEPAHKRAVQVAQAKPRCLDCGVVESVRVVEVKGQGTGLGAVAGGVAGAVLGNQMGNGNGRTVMTLVGAAGGALAGNQIEKSARTTKHWDVSVRMEDGATRVISLAAEPAWRPGDHVRVVNGALQPLN
ncbi:MAG: glycine zipper 2TM domain-containing protein [Betaproteobacteria bacterium]|nr:glycine zipper 2TM domain-containing protein [Betaproteobacteria bacterium]